MRRRWPKLIGWSARLGGWAVLLALFIHVAWNHEGIGVRGQFARLSLASERGAALQDLLDRAGLANRPSLSYPADSTALNHTFFGPLATLWKRSSVLHLSENRPDRGVADIFVCFNGDGRPAGAPVRLARVQDRMRSRQYWPMPQGKSDEFLIVYELQQVLTTMPATAPARSDIVFRVFRLGFPRSPEVLGLEVARAARQFPSLLVGQNDVGQATLDLIVYTWTGGSPLAKEQTLATFTWDDDLGRFVGPKRDPQGRWKVTFPPPKPKHRQK